MNAHEQLARARKVDRLAFTLRVLRAESFVELTDAEFAARLRSRPPKFWAELAEVSGVRAPSEKTIAAVLRALGHSEAA